MGLSDDQLANPETVSDTLRCAICIEVLEQPVYCSGNPCQHVFCLECIEQALATRQRCPTCRAPARKEQFQPNLVVQSLLDELHVYCKRRQAGCYWSGRQDARTAHEDVCLAKKLTLCIAELSNKDRLIKEQDAQLAHLGSHLALPQQSSKLQEGFLRSWGVPQSTAVYPNNCSWRFKISTRYGIIASLLLIFACFLPFVLRRDRHVMDAGDPLPEAADGRDQISEIPTRLVEHKFGDERIPQHRSKISDVSVFGPAVISEIPTRLVEHKFGDERIPQHRSNISDFSVFGPAVLHQKELHKRVDSRPVADKSLHEHRQPKQ